MINESIIKNHLSMNHLSIINHQMYSIYVMGKKSSSHQTPSKSSTPRRGHPPLLLWLPLRAWKLGASRGLARATPRRLGFTTTQWNPVSKKVKKRGEKWKHVKNGAKTGATEGVWNHFLKKTKKWWMWRGNCFSEKIMACWLRGDLESETQLLLTQKINMEMNELTFFFQSRACFCFESSPKFHPQVSSAAPIGRFSLEITVNPPGQRVHIPPWENVGIRLYIVFI